MCLQLRDARGTTHIRILGQWNLAMDMASTIVHHFNLRVLQHHHDPEKHGTFDHSYCTLENFTSSPLLYMKRNLISSFSCDSTHYHFYPSSSVHFSASECCRVLSEVLINLFESWVMWDSCWEERELECVCMFGTGKQIKTTQNKHPNLCLSCGVVETGWKRVAVQIWISLVNFFFYVTWAETANNVCSPQSEEGRARFL